MYSLEFTIHALPKIISNGSHGHWATKYAHAKKWHGLVAQAIGPNKPLAPLSAVSGIFIRGSSTPPDYDGLVISFKPLIDALVKCAVLQNDRINNLPNPKYLWEKAAPKRGFIKISIKEVHV